MNRKLLVVATAFLLAACHGHHDHDGTVVVTPAPAPLPEPRPVSIEIEVYDPVSGFVWQDVGVRVVEAYSEWSDCLCESPFLDDWYYTDEFGVVFLDDIALAEAQVGLAEDVFARAVLEPYEDADQAIVTLEVWGPGFLPVFVDVDLSWDQPSVFVSVPFE